MPGVLDAVKALLEASESIMAHFDGAPAPRIYSGPAPQGAASPYITYFEADARTESAMGVDVGVAHSRVQIDVWCADASGLDARGLAQELGREVDFALRRRRGTFGGVVVQDVLREDRSDADWDEATGVHRVRQDFTIHWEEAVPA